MTVCLSLLVVGWGIVEVVFRLWVFGGYRDIQLGQIHACQNLSAEIEKDVWDKGRKGPRFRFLQNFTYLCSMLNSSEANHIQWLIRRRDPWRFLCVSQTHKALFYKKGRQNKVMKNCYFSGVHWESGVTLNFQNMVELDLASYGTI